MDGTQILTLGLGLEAPWLSYAVPCLSGTLPIDTGPTIMPARQTHRQPRFPETLKVKGCV